ncbi:hypothetical protein ABE83_12600 [Streptomyces sp. CFMR 7]|nr:hypothetical protein ABE83_12600 [Streptomyces sp. CFMR 7]
MGPGCPHGSTGPRDALPGRFPPPPTAPACRNKGRKLPSADGPVRRFLVAAIVADGMLVVAAGCAVAAVIVG